MLRTREKVTGVVVAFAAVGLLAACGDNDSTASSTPTLKTSTAPASPAPTIPSVVQVPPEENGQQPAPTTTSAAERPEPVQPSPAASNPAELSAKDQALIDELKKRGINPTSDVAVTTASFVCQGKAANMPPDQLTTYVNAMAGSDPQFDPQKMPVEQAGQIYIDVATKSYCGQ
ncbi:type IV secretory pathway VirB10-like protein [Nocardia transvalensis]|uniref:Type IV secretory pathway VirB10-like protein n=1 Tax=Nocardia transvalensis TaxID=37333 RepID=A0A7W9UI08_9NOCA|nr:DUF732 domain-containing protein [Nocardia transvalensis]MBB5913652.1 type IV secretory pathway VirB10-like protein [Nocardia transvalensis]